MMCAKKFDSVLASPMGDFVRSPLGVRDADVSNRAVYTIAHGSSVVDGRVFFGEEQLFRLSLDDLSTSIDEARPPWWPAPHPELGVKWWGDGISGDADTIWYSAFNLVDFYDFTETPDARDQRWTIDIFKLTGAFEVVNSWRWHQPQIGGGRAWHISPYGDLTSLWGLARVSQFPQPFRVPEEMYLVELDPDTMAVRRTSPDLWAGLSELERSRQAYARSGGGNSSAIFLSRWIGDLANERRYQIMEYSSVDFSLVRVTDGPRTAAPIFNEKRQIFGIGADSESIWLASRWQSPVDTWRVSELPRDFSNDNRTVLQDEIRPPAVDTGDDRLTIDIG